MFVSPFRLSFFTFLDLNFNLNLNLNTAVTPSLPFILAPSRFTPPLESRAHLEMHGRRNIIVGGVVILLSLTAVSADQCAAGSKEVAGNWYCQPVEAIKYSNVGSPGTYNQITNMGTDGSCSSTPKSFSGPLAPLDEEVSFHFRGPISLKQFAAYTLSSAKKREEPVLQERAHGSHHRHLHNRPRSEPAHQEQERDGQPPFISAVIDGKLVSWSNPNYVAAATPQPANANPAPAPAPAPAAKTTAQAAPAKSPEPAPASPSTGGAGTYNRIGYYNSASQTLDNLAFLGNYGGQGSGVFDYKFGASLAYANSAGTGGASSPQILADTLLTSDVEIVVMSGKDCSDGGCGYTRPGSVTHHGFDGADKVFMIEYSMPSDGKTGFNGDMPAIWMLNAQIPRTLQYGDADCSCWESGCGEFDIAEALNSGSTFLKSTLHTNKPAGDSDYIVRPTSNTMKLAVVFESSSSTIHIQVLPDNTEFPTSISANDISTVCSASSEKLTSNFQVT
ncbi:hypothetical protein G7Y89_g1231 [Cudoniella acicularis]|uniref:glucan endo-1,3-beta-D-glucosidase n=1 Tax=Cudoniella acicularis TaxID=354080 RepID=A0A8H4RWI2_9HELO|nr:hypothetical protein G7Y89_g1231 [Cudoniella acicularis]